MDIRYGTSNVKCSCSASSLKIVASKLAKYNFDLMAVQEVRWEKDENQQMIIHFTMEMGMLIISLEQSFLYIRKSDQQLTW